MPRTCSDGRLALWRGPAYAGFEAAAFGQAEGRRLEELRLTATEDRWAALRSTGGRTAAAVGPRSSGWWASTRCGNEAWGLPMLGLYRGGRGRGPRRLRARGVRCSRTSSASTRDPSCGRCSEGARPGPLAGPARRTSLPPGWSAGKPDAGPGAGVDPVRAAWGRAERGDGVSVLVRGPSGAGATRLATGGWPERSRGTGAEVVLADHEADLRATGREAAPAGRGRPPPRPARRPGMPGGGARAGARPKRPDHGGEGPRPPRRRRRCAASDRAVRGGCRPWWPFAQVLAESGGWPGRVHEVAVELARRPDAAGERGVADRAAASSVRAGPGRADRRGARLAARPGGPAYGPDRRVPVEGARELRRRRRGVVRRAGTAVAELVSRLAGNRLVGVVGASGSGKSSLLRAGLLGGAGRRRAARAAGWQQILVGPGRTRCASCPAGAGHPAGRHRRPAGPAHPRPATDDARVVLVVDQLEEVWTACQDDGERAAFLDALAELAGDPGSPVTVVLAVRADYVARSRSTPSWPGREPTHRARRVAQACGGRARGRAAGGRRWAASGGRSCADALVTDAGAEPGLLPLLSTAH